VRSCRRGDDDVERVVLTELMIVSVRPSVCLSLSHRLIMWPGIKRHLLRATEELDGGRGGAGGRLRPAVSWGAFSRRIHYEASYHVTWRTRPLCDGHIESPRRRVNGVGSASVGAPTQIIQLSLQEFALFGWRLTLPDCSAKASRAIIRLNISSIPNRSKSAI